MEVSSPVREPQEAEEIEGESKEADAELPALVLPAEEAQVESAEPSPVAAEEARPRSESDASFVSCLSTASVPKSTTAPASASPNTAHFFRSRPFRRRR
jgi:hypothetical protein